MRRSTEVLAAAERLWHAAENGVPCPPVRDLIGPQDLRRAYDVQQELVERSVSAGASIVGRKIGATSQAVQRQLGVEQPDFGVLFAHMDVSSYNAIPMDRLMQAKVEAEVAFVLGEDLAEGTLDGAQARDAIDYAVAAIEVVDSRIAGWDISFADTVADNASSGLYVLGDTKRDLSEFEPAEVSMEMRVNGAIVSTGSGRDCLGDPVHALVWLARRARDYGQPLRAGQLVLSGALGPMHPVSPGDEVSVAISGLGSVNAKFGPAHVPGSPREGANR